MSRSLQRGRGDDQPRHEHGHVEPGQRARPADEPTGARRPQPRRPASHEPRERDEREERRGAAEDEDRAVALRQRDEPAGRRERDRRPDRAHREEERRVAAGLAGGNDRREHGVAGRRDDAESGRGRDQPRRDELEARRQRDGEQARSEERDAEEEGRPELLRVADAARSDRERCRDEPERRQPDRRDRGLEAEHVLGVEDEERGQRGVRENPEDLGEEQRADVRPRRGLAVEADGMRAFDRLGGGDLRLGDPCESRKDEQRQQHRRGRERRPQGDLRQEAAGHEAEHRPGQEGDLLGARGACAPPGDEELGDERPVGRGDGVEADVDRGAEDRERQVRGRCPERDGRQAAGGDDAPAEDERQPRSGSPRAAPVAPVPDDERDGEPGAGVHEHHEPDQARRALDPVEEHGQVRGGDGPPGARRRRQRRRRRPGRGPGGARAGARPGRGCPAIGAHGLTKREGVRHDLERHRPRAEVRRVRDDRRLAEGRNADALCRPRPRARPAEMRAATQVGDHRDDPRASFPRQRDDVEQAIVRPGVRRDPEAERVEREVRDEELADAEQLGLPVARDADRDAVEAARSLEPGADGRPDVGRVRCPVARSRNGVEPDADPLDREVALRRARRRDEVDRARAAGGRELGRRADVEGDAERPRDVVRPPGGEKRELGRDERQVGGRMERSVPSQEDDAAIAELGPRSRELGDALRHPSLDAHAVAAERAGGRPENGVRAPEPARAPVRDENDVAGRRAPGQRAPSRKRHLCRDRTHVSPRYTSNSRSLHHCFTF